MTNTREVGLQDIQDGIKSDTFGNIAKMENRLHMRDFVLG